MKKRVIIVISIICLISVIIFWWVNVKNSPRKVADTVLLAIESNDEMIFRSVLNDNYYEFILNKAYRNISEEELDKQMLQDIKYVGNVAKATFGKLENINDLVSDEYVEEEKNKIAVSCKVDNDSVGDIMKFTYYIEENTYDESIVNERDLTIAQVDGIWYAFYIY